MKSQILFLDTETTSKDNGRLVQLAVKKPGFWNEECMEFKYKPAEPICFEAMAVHHITEEDVAGLKTFEESGERCHLQKELNSCILVAHNAKFDIGVLEREGLTVPNFIDTLKVARYLLPDMPNHQLQYLRYALHLDVSKAATAHDAVGDVLALEALFHNLFWKTVDVMFDDATIDKVQGKTNDELQELVHEKMIEISKKPSLVKVLRFGKYAGKDIVVVIKEDRNYINWLLGRVDLDEDLKYSIDYYSKEQKLAI